MPMMLLLERRPTAPPACPRFLLLPEVAVWLRLPLPPPRSPRPGAVPGAALPARRLPGPAPRPDHRWPVWAR